MTGHIPSAAEEPNPVYQRTLDSNNVQMEWRTVDLLSAVHCGLILVDTKGIIQAINEHLTTILGFVPDELIGRDLCELIPIRFRENHGDYVNSYSQSPRVRRMGNGIDVIAVHKSGAEIDIEVGLSPVMIRGDAFTMATIIDISEHKAIANELRRTKDDIRSIIDHLPAMICYWDSDLRNRFSNKVYTEWFDVGPDQMLGRHKRDVIGEQMFAENLRYLEGVLNGSQQIFERTSVDPTGARIYAEVIYVPDFREGQVHGFFELVTDITKRKNAELALMEEKEWARVTLSSIGDGVIATDENGLVTFLNPIAQDMTGASQELANGVAIEEVMDILNSKTREPVVNPIRMALSENRIVGLAADSVLQHRGSQEFNIEDSAAPIRDADGRTVGAVIVFHDVSEAHLMASRVSHMAQHDALTDLPNRLLLQDRITQVIQFAHRDTSRFAVLFVDLDRFKHINDSLGHATGDNLLRAFASRLESAVRPSDTVSRLGGDEFVILLPQVESADDAGQIARNLIKVISEPFEVDGHRLAISASVGISMYPDDGESTHDLLQHADAAMYRSKKAGPNRFQFVTREMNLAVMARQVLELELREALTNNEFSVYYQVIVDSATSQITGAEALVRWHRSDGHIVEPSEFISLAEESGLIISIGRLVLAEACRQMRSWQVDGLSIASISVNVSASQLLSPDLVSNVEAILAETALSPQCLELEITETTLIETVGAAKASLEALRALGVRIALDDFGTGYSSLSYLRTFPVSTLKIDRSFVADLAENSNGLGIVSAIVGMARGLGVKVVAEGVETQEQADLLSALQCHSMQGFLFSRPVTAAEATAIMVEGASFSAPKEN